MDEIGAVFAKALDGARLGITRVSVPAMKRLKYSSRNGGEQRYGLISLANFPAGEGYGRGRPAASPWPVARM
jgi:hypothetical protein